MAHHSFFLVKFLIVNRYDEIRSIREPDSASIEKAAYAQGSIWCSAARCSCPTSPISKLLALTRFSRALLNFIALAVVAFYCKFYEILAVQNCVGMSAMWWWTAVRWRWRRYLWVRSRMKRIWRGRWQAWRDFCVKSCILMHLFAL